MRRLTHCRAWEVDVKRLLNVAFAPLIQSITVWLGVWFLRGQGVSLAAWAVLYACCFSAASALQHSRFTRYVSRPSAWLLFSVNSVLVAVLFWGANAGLDLIGNTNRQHAEWPAYFGGLELWFALCPGVFSVAIAGYARSLRLQRLQRTQAQADDAI